MKLFKVIEQGVDEALGRRGTMISVGKFALCVVVFMLTNQSCQSPTDGLRPAPSVHNKNLEVSEKIVQIDTAKIKLVAKILRKIYKDPSVRAEVSVAVAAGYYKDERILLKDLLQPAISNVYKLGKFKAMKLQTKALVEEGRFAKKFREVAVEFLKSSGNARAQGDDYFTQDDTHIYYPYSEDHVGSTYPITVAEPGENSDFTYAPHPECDGTIENDRYCQQRVRVSDSYAANHPTHIIDVGQIVPAGEYHQAKPEINKVFLGWVRCTNQYDPIIDNIFVRRDLRDEGGSEIRICRGSAYLKFENQQVTSFEDVISVNFSRRDVRRGIWKRVYSIWDSDWEVDNAQQVLGIYEEDNEGTRTYTGSLTTKVKAGTGGDSAEVSGTRGYSITVKTKDDIIRQLQISRESFFRDGKNNQAHGFYDDGFDGQNWPIYDGASGVSFTMPFRQIQ